MERHIVLIKELIIGKFRDRFDLSEIETLIYNNDKVRLYKLIDNWTDNVYFKTYTQLTYFKPVNFKKQEMIDKIVDKFGQERFDFSKSVIQKKTDIFEIYDNFLFRTHHKNLFDILNMKIVNKPDKEDIIRLIIEYFDDTLDIENMEYFSHNLPIKIKNLKTGTIYKRTWNDLKKLSSKVRTAPKSKLERKKNSLTVLEIFNFLVNTYPNYSFDLNNLFSFKIDKNGKRIKTIIYKDNINSEVYSYQTLAHLETGMGRKNSKAYSKEQVLEKLKIIPCIDLGTVVFPESTFDFKTNYFLIRSSKIKYKKYNNPKEYIIKIDGLLHKKEKTRRKRNHTRDEILKLFTNLDRYNNFDFSYIEFDEDSESLFGIKKKKFKIYNKITKQFRFYTYHDFKTNVVTKEEYRQTNKKSYIYLDKSVTTKKGHVDIICPSHGNFSQWSNNHFYRGDCCPLCNASIGETKIYQYFYNNDMKFIFKYKAHKLMKLDYLRFDFYLPEFDIYIQYNGEHHYETVKWANSITDEQLEDNLKQEQLHDQMKFEYCEKNSLNYIILKYDQLNNLENCLEKELYKIIDARKI